MKPHILVAALALIVVTVAVVVSRDDDGGRDVVGQEHEPATEPPFDPDFAGDPSDLRRRAAECVALWNGGSDADEVWAAGLQRQGGRALATIYASEGEAGCRVVLAMPESGVISHASYDDEHHAYVESAAEWPEPDPPRDEREGEVEGGEHPAGDATVTRSGALKLDEAG